MIRLLLWIGGVSVAIAIIGAIALVLLSPGTTAPYPDAPPDSIASIEMIELGGAAQFVQMRGRSTANPVLLLLHGGPGSAQSPHFSYYNAALEEHFIVVNWDQRGAGRSFSDDVPRESMTLEQFVADAHELTQFLKQRFNKPKIYLLGHSWGSYLGIYTAHRHPEDYHAFIAIGQVADQARSELRSYNYVLSRVRELGDQGAIEELQAIGAPEGGRYRDGYRGLLKQRDFVQRYGGATREPDQFLPMMAWPIMVFDGYHLSDKLNYLNASNFSLDILFDTVLRAELIDEIDRLEVPYFLLHARRDLQTTFDEAERYFNQLDAPMKRLFVFDNSAHLIPYEEPEAFHRIMVDEVLMATQR